MVTSSTRKAVAERVHQACFKSVHGHRLLYNSCWEDPRIDRDLFGIGPGSRVLVITSGGCNVLDYLLDDPAEVVAVDVNPRQNALLELKLAMIRRGRHEDLFALFGRGAHPDFEGIWRELREELPVYAREYWERKRGYFNGRVLRRSFYYHGAAGEAAWVFRGVLFGLHRRVRDWVEELMEAPTLEAQRAAYERIEPALFGRVTCRVLRHPLLLAMLGIHKSQLALIEKEYAGGVPDYLVSKLRQVFTRTPIGENYFWRVYIRGEYTAGCCPNYLRPENFDVLRRRVDRVRVVTGTMTEALRAETEPFTQMTLLDHQDWLACHDTAALEAEWQALMDRSVRGARILLRSAGLAVDFIPEWVRERVRFELDRTQVLHRLDRVGTYGSLHLAEVR